MAYLVHLVTNLRGTDAADAMEDVFTRVASEAIGLAEPAPAGTSPFDALRRGLDKRTVRVSDWCHPNGVVSVSGGEWDRGEVETNLRQIEIIVLALRSSILRAATEVKLNPTQQGGFDAEGKLKGTAWVLEAFGGVNVKNNNKLAEDGEALSRAPEGTRRFFACRPRAWTYRSERHAVKAGVFVLVNHADAEGVRLFEFAPSSTG
ncbi:MAG: hypothetical protein KF795_22865 [Labilithrix sp.]|nr:hypothetical protein [Labilithrix sp.]